MNKLASIETKTGCARDRSGRFGSVTRCDCCDKPVTGEHLSDSRVCGNDDGPGFYLCDRKRCEAKREKLEAAGGIEGLRVAYTATRSAR